MDYIDELYNSTLQRNWERIVKIYEEHPYLHAATTTKTGDTALHVAAVHAPQDIVARLVGVIKNTSYEECLGDEDIVKEENNKNKSSPEGSCLWILSAKNKRGHTPLHYAASRGSLAMCKCILGDEYFFPLVYIRNNEGETPLFLAALHGHKEAFLYLHYASINCRARPSTTPWRRNGGDTILHFTIQREYFDLSFQIIHLYKPVHIATAVNERGITPLRVLANKPSAFKSGTHFRWWTKLLYHCIIVKPLQLAMLPTEFQSVVIDTPEDSKSKTMADEHINLPQNYRTCHKVFALLHKAGHKLSAKEGGALLEIRKIKEKHLWCSQVMDELVQEYSNDEYYMLDNGSEPTLDTSELKEISLGKSKNVSSSYDVRKGTEDQRDRQDKASKKDDQEMEEMTALLVAAKNGVKEMMKKILNSIPIAIHETTTENKNILVVAVENRQPHIIQALMNHDAWDSLIQTADNEGNNILHLAAKVSTYKHWQVSGSAMQMQWEIKWYQQFVKSIAPSHLNFQTNNEGYTPGEIFTESHKGIVKESSVWLTNTAQSCSAVATLIAGVAFATSTSVPGGTDEITGKPNLQGHPAFDVFTITSLVALCFSITALIMFLAILTSRHQPRDFKPKELPLKLLLALTSLFVSIVFMLISFCAVNFFMSKDKMHKVVFAIYVGTCVPMSFYVVAQFPLYFDLLTATLTKVPQPSYKGDDL